MNLDKLTYAGNLESLSSVSSSNHYYFVQSRDLLEELTPNNLDDNKYRDLVTFVTGKPRHDIRYAIDAGTIEKELNWRPQDGSYQRARLGNKI